MESGQVANTAPGTVEEDNPNGEFKFPSHVLWTEFFTIDRTAKTMTCKLCTRALKYQNSPRTDSANSHLNAKKCRQLVLAKLSKGIEPNYWTEDR